MLYIRALIENLLPKYVIDETIANKSDTRFYGKERDIFQLAACQRKQQALLEGINYEGYLKKLKACPEIHYQESERKRLSGSAQLLLKDIDQLYEKKPLTALRLVFCLIYEPKVIYYQSIPYSKENPLGLMAMMISEDNLLLMNFIEQLQSWLVSERITCIDRLTILFECYDSWPMTFFKLTKKSVFNSALNQNFIEYINIDDKEAWQLFNQYFPEEPFNNIQLSYQESLDFIEVIQYFKDFSSEKYQNALIAFLSKYSVEENLKYENKAETLGADISNTSEKLYQSFISSKDLSDDQVIKICQTLIVYGDNGYDWYSSLFDILWEIEKQRNLVDQGSLETLLIIALNAPKESAFLNDAINCIDGMTKQYQHIPLETPEPLIQYLIQIMNICSDAFANYQGQYKHKTTVIENPGNPILNVIMDNYCEMIDWVAERNLSATLHALIITSLYQEGMVHKINSIALLSRVRFFELLPQFIEQSPKEAFEFLLYLFNSANFDGTPLDAFGRVHNLQNIMNNVYPLFLCFNQEKTLEALAKSYHCAIEANITLEKTSGRKSSRLSNIWLPADFSSNPIYQEIMIKGKEYGAY